MVRNTSRAHSVGRAPSVGRIRKQRDAQKDSTKYKTVFESVVRKKKKLKTKEIIGNHVPPNGYTFLPVGYSDLAQECKEMSRNRDAPVSIVSAGVSSRNDPTTLSHHIHRVGYHFESNIFDKACQKLGYACVNGKLERAAGHDSSARFYHTRGTYGQLIDGIDLTDESEEKKIKVKKYIRELFPNVPEQDLDEIYARAWREGAKTVGNAKDVSLTRAVQLATLARIRHTYTNYDQLLRQVPWVDARRKVERPCLDKLIEWRGERENENENDELEEILREVVVIDDDDDDENDDNAAADDSGTAAPMDVDESDSSIELVQNTIAANDLSIESDEGQWLSAHRQQATSGRPRQARTIQDRWRDARARYRGHVATLPNANSSMVEVGLDEQGRAPDAIICGGVKYSRLPPSPSSQTARPNVSGPLTHHGDFAAPVHSGHPRMWNREPEETSRVRESRTHYHGPVATQSAPEPSTVPLRNERILQSVERPFTAMYGSKPYSQIETIDLTTPPRQRGMYREPVQTGTSGQISPYVAYPAAQPGPTHRDNVVSVPDMPRSTEAPLYSLQRYEKVEPLNSFRRYEKAEPYNSSRPEHRAEAARHHKAFGKGYIQADPWTQLARGSGRPVPGEPAYPSLRSTAATTPAPRPIHGAPSVVQQKSPTVTGPAVPAFGAPFGKGFSRRPPSGLVKQDHRAPAR